ncbi:MAG: TolC family protein, partial [Pseudomonadota bacterium]
RAETGSFKSDVRPVRLNEVLEQGLRQSHDEQIRQYKSEFYDLQWDDNHRKFWLPHVKLTMTTEEKRLSRIHRGSKQGYAYSEPASGELGLEFGEYTLFNWGKDYLKYLNQQTDYLRNKQSLYEKKRNLKQELIIRYFELVNSHDIEDVLRQQLRHTSFIYRLNRERLAIGKAPKQEYLQARSEYLRAQNEFYQARTNTQLLEEKMSYYLSDPVGTRYILRDKLKYQQLNTQVDEVVKISRQSNGEILDSVRQVETTNRDYEVTLKENLPLPKISVNLGAYTHSFNRNNNQTSYETHPGDSNIDVVASINASWSIFGEGGLFNASQRAMAVVNRNMALEGLNRSKDLATNNVREYFRTVHHLQNQMSIMEAKVEVARKAFDVIMDNYINRKSSFVTFKDALNDRTQSEIQFALTKLEHLRNKVLMAQAMGVENPPGEILERLVIEEKVK